MLEVALALTAHMRTGLWCGDGNGEPNIEHLTASALRRANVRVLRPQLPMFLVRAPSDGTRWSHGSWLYLRNMTIEQHEEMRRYEQMRRDKFGQEFHHNTDVTWRLAAERTLATLPGARRDLETCLRVKMEGTELEGASRMCASSRDVVRP